MMIDGDKVRSTLGFILFDRKSFEIQNDELVTFAKQVRDVFNQWIHKKNNWIIKFTYEEIKSQKPDSGTIVFWNVCRKRCATALLLYSVIPFYNEKKNKHGQLILDLLDAILDNNKNIDTDEIKNLDLQYYWHPEFPIYLNKTLELLDMTDEQFKKLGDFEDWLNNKN